jgi:glycosidase
MVLNHTALDHPWFQSARSSEDSPYRDYYVWKELQSVRNEISKKSITLDSDNITQWHVVNNDTTQEHYYGFFSRFMPDLNFDNQKVRDEFIDISRFWLDTMQVDGFRFDAARHIYPDDNAFANHQFWKWYKTELQKIKPDVYLVGEVYSINWSEVSYYTKGLPSLFNFYIGQSIITSLDSGKNIGLINTYERMIDSYKLSNPDYIDAPILTNHDQNRILSQLG